MVEDLDVGSWRLRTIEDIGVGSMMAMDTDVQSMVEEGSNLDVGNDAWCHGANLGWPIVFAANLCIHTHDFPAFAESSADRERRRILHPMNPPRRRLLGFDT
eukprot:CAMPEP_0114500566 /NCGR_PEP_ID=MMETSP0109-20121206/8032_1 /TAXON_ID=29199 /ORGANISM="Chlorarachnion reptans, Strain CCCM449" /LENGTH=101 /DNA_ID=CAMNT_0001678235 /DNA_START=1259 /DNA_END=1564 /DNA_ORIENTATION=+